ALLGLLLGRVRDNETRSRGLLGFERLDHDTVLEGLDGDRHLSDLPFRGMSRDEFWTRQRSVVVAGADGAAVGTLIPKVPTLRLVLRWHSVKASARHV